MVSALLVFPPEVRPKAGRLAAVAEKEGRMNKRLGAVAAFALGIGVVACGDDGGPAPYGSQGPNGDPNSPNRNNNGVIIGPDGVPIGADGKPLEPKLDGKYELSSEFDLTTAGLLPEVMNETLKALSNFREKPTQTFIDLADAANVPFVSIINSVPELIRGLVLGFIDDHVFKALYETVPVTEKITGIMDDLASIVTRFEVVTTLDVPMGNAIGDVKATHTISGVGYRWDQKRHVIAAPDLISKLVQQEVDGNAVTLEKKSPQLESGRLKLGDHTFSVPVGSFAVYAADELARDKFGAADLRGALGKVVNCEALAEDVSKRCIDPPGPGKICVDHRSEIKQICTIGLDLLVGALQGAILQLDIPVLNLKDGVAQMWDALEPNGALDATIDRIDHGFWTANIKVTQEDKPVVATFTGRRIGDTAMPSRPSTSPH
jgi:hypothetical protein